MASTFRDKQVNVRFSSTELEALRQRAASAGVSVSDFIRYRALNDTPVTLAGVDQHLAGLEDAISTARRALGGTT